MLDGLLFKCLLDQDFPSLPSITERRVLKSPIVIVDLALCILSNTLKEISLVKKAKPNYCLPETHLQYNEKYKLKGKRWKSYTTETLIKMRDGWI